MLALKAFFFHYFLFHVNINNSVNSVLFSTFFPSFLVSSGYNTISQAENERTTWQISSFCIDSTFLEFTRSVFPSISYSSDILYRIYRQRNPSERPVRNRNVSPMFHYYIQSKCRIKIEFFLLAFLSKANLNGNKNFHHLLYNNFVLKHFRPMLPFYTPPRKY